MIESRKFLLFVRGIVWAYFCFLTVMSLIPMPEIVAVNFNDLVLHCGAYFALMWLFSQGYPEKSNWSWMIGFALWGVMLEGAQAILPYRVFEYADMIANGAGVILGWAFSRWHRPIFIRRNEGRTPLGHRAK